MADWVLAAVGSWILESTDSVAHMTKFFQEALPEVGVLMAAKLEKK